jgi:hypothetical protein
MAGPEHVASSTKEHYHWPPCSFMDITAVYSSGLSYTCTIQVANLSNLIPFFLILLDFLNDILSKFMNDDNICLNFSVHWSYQEKTHWYHIL